MSSPDGAPPLDHALRAARALAAAGQDERAKLAYVRILARDPTHAPALNELGSLADASGHRAAARTAFAQAAKCHPGDPAGHVNLANLLLEDGDFPRARGHYVAALAADPTCHLAHQGMARVLREFGEEAVAAHWERGFSGHAVVTRRYRGAGTGIPLLMLVSARGGNIPTRHLIDESVFAVTAIHADYFDPSSPLPPHALIVNAIGDAELAADALDGAEKLSRRATAPVINVPQLVRRTGRVENSRRLACIEGVMTPAIVARSRASLLADASLAFPLLLRAPGFHTGRHFVLVASRADLATAAAAFPGETILAIEFFPARGPDGLARKYRAMVIDGVLYPLHLAISADWKVHYFSAAMAENSAHRAEEKRFLDDMGSVIGNRAMAALAKIGEALGLDYAGIDFALAPDGSVLLFEANATMVINPPDPGRMWDYRRPAIAAALSAAHRMFLRRAGAG